MVQCDLGNNKPVGISLEVSIKDKDIIYKLNSLIENSSILNPQRNQRDDIYNIGANGSSAYKLVSALYKTSGIYLDRKYNKAIDIFRKYGDNYGE